MLELWTIGGITASLVGYLATEHALHQKRLLEIPIRIHVNGTRGKSSVTRLIAAGLRAGGIRTCAKTTGTLPRMILPDARELPVFRPAGANIREQIRIVAVARAFEAKALVLECMALQPLLQWLSEEKIVRATHGVITNARPDHLDVMGPGPEDVARALCGMVPRSGTLYTAEQTHLPILGDAAKDRKSGLVAIDDDAVAAITPADLEGFSYREHPDNVAVALRVCEDLDVPRETALRGMWAAKPDSGAMTERILEFFGREVTFFNAFAANDPMSTEQIWRMVMEKRPPASKSIVVMNCRSDRADRSIQLGEALATWTPPDHVVLVGSGTALFARAAVKAGVEPTKLVSAEPYSVSQIFEMIMELVDEKAYVVGMGNIGGPGLELVRFFHNRSIPVGAQREKGRRVP